jgi:hypothetical protein
MTGKGVTIDVRVKRCSAETLPPERELEAAK